MNGHRTAPTLGALILFAVSVLLVVAGTGYAVFQGSRQAQDLSAQEQVARYQAQVLAREIHALCAEQGDIGGAPLTGKTAELGVKLVADFRDAYAGLGCSPALPPPSPLLLRLAKFYGIPVRHLVSAERR